MVFVAIGVVVVVVGVVRLLVVRLNVLDGVLAQLEIRAGWGRVLKRTVSVYCCVAVHALRLVLTVSPVIVDGSGVEWRRCGGGWTTTASVLYKRVPRGIAATHRPSGPSKSRCSGRWAAQDGCGG